MESLFFESEDKETIITRHFKKLFFDYYDSLCFFLYKYIPEYTVCEDIAQDVFYELWKSRHKLDLSFSMKHLLYKAARNKALNYLKSHEHSKTEKLDSLSADSSNPDFRSLAIQQDEELYSKDLADAITQIIAGLSPQCNKIFVLSREAGLKNKEIAATLSISIKAVEKQIAKALQIIRSELYKKGYLLSFSLIFISIKIIAGFLSFCSFF